MWPNTSRARKSAFVFSPSHAGLSPTNEGASERERDTPGVACLLAHDRELAGLTVRSAVRRSVPKWDGCGLVCEVDVFESSSSLP